MHHLRSYQLAVEFYRIAKGVELPGHLKDQLRRAASSRGAQLKRGKWQTDRERPWPFLFHCDGLSQRVSGGH